MEGVKRDHLASQGRNETNIQEVKSDEFWAGWILVSVPLSPSLPIPACLPRVQTCIWKLLHQGSSFTSLLQPSVLISASLWKERPGRQPVPAQQCKRQTHHDWRQGLAAEEGLREGLFVLPWKEAGADCCCWKNMTLGVQLIVFSLLMWWMEESHSETTRMPAWHCKRDHGKIKKEPNYPSAALSCRISSYWIKCCLPAP